MQETTLRWLTLAAAGALGVMMTGGCAKPPSSAPPSAGMRPPSPAMPMTSSQAQGKALFGRTCAGCHGATGSGLPNMGSNLVTSKFARSKTDAQLAAFIKVGRSATDPQNTMHVPMPAKGGNPSLTDKDLEAVAAYVHWLEKQAGQ